MKKILAILCVLAMLSMLCVPALAVEGVDTLSIVGTGLPGIAEWSTDDAAGVMEQTEDGIFVKELSLTAGSTITFKFAANKTWDVNYGGATVVAGEAVALTPNGNDISLAVDKDTTLKFTVDLNAVTLKVEGEGITAAPEAPVEPAGDLQKLSMMGEGLPTLNWDPGNPANEMKKEGNVFVKELGVSAGTTIKFKFAGNGAWDAGYNFGSGIIEVGTPVEMANGGDSQDMTFTATETCTLKFTVDCSAVADGGAATVLLEILPPAPPPEIEGDTITISVDPFNDWTQVLLYVWNDQGEYAAWPGVAMTDADGDGWYEMPVPVGFTGLIVSNGNGYQTDDLIIDGEMDMWVTIRADETGMTQVDLDPFNPGPALNQTTPIPEPDPLEKLSLMGEGDDELNWDTTNPANEMTKVGETFIKEIQVAAGSALKIKFAGNGAWDSGFNYGGGAITIGEKMELTSNGGDMTLTVDADCILKFTVDTTGVLEGTIPTMLVEQTLVEGSPVDPTEPSEPVVEPTEPSAEPTEEPSTAPAKPSESESTAPATEATQPADKNEKDGGNNTTLIVIIVAAVVVAGSVVVILVAKKKK